MNQDIIALIIVAVVVCYAIYKIVRNVSTKSESLCGDGCSGCSIKNEIKKNIHHKNKVKIPMDLKVIR